MDEIVKWVLDGSFPMDGNLVLIEVAAFNADGHLTGTEVITGFLDGEVWRCADAVPVQHVVSWAEMPLGTRRLETDANAALISAAPDLLSALTRMAGDTEKATGGGS